MTNTSGNLWIKSNHIVVPLNYPAVSGSKYVDRDFTKARRALLDPKGDIEFWRSGIPIKRIPLGKKWCSQHPTARHVDPALEFKKPDLFWELQGYVDKDLFKPDKGFRDGRYPICRECRNRHDRELYALMKAEKGEKVRAYRRNGEQNKALSA